MKRRGAPNRPLVVAIDGPAGAGKSTASRRLARELGYDLLDTGALYRSVALLATRRGVSLADAAGLARIAAGLQVQFVLRGEINHVYLEGNEVTEELRTPQISQLASRISALPEVRSALLALQRRLGARGGVVAEGRDVGTVVFPEAEAKFFLTASAPVRARRRLEELAAAGVAADFDAVHRELQERDERDLNRGVAPLARAADAIVIDSTSLTADEVVERMLAALRP